jgi:hypothetical protein
MALVPEMTNEGTPALGEPFFFSFLWKHWSSSHRYFEPSRSHNWIVGVVIFHSGNPECSKCFGRKNSPQDYQPHVDPSPSSPVRFSSHSSLARSPSIPSSSLGESSEASNPVNKKKKKRKIKKKKYKQGSKPPTTVKHVGKQPDTINRAGSVDDVKIAQTTLSPSTLAGFVRVAIFLRNALVYPKL